MYFTDRGIDELIERRGGEAVPLGWVAERLRQLADGHPGFADPVMRFASWLAWLPGDGSGRSPGDEQG